MQLCRFVCVGSCVSSIWACALPLDPARGDGVAVAALAGAPAQQAYAKASNTGAGDLFGWSVALSGDGSILAASARNEASAAIGIDGVQDNNAAAQAGAVYVFH
jgi:hypothetical protein